MSGRPVAPWFGPPALLLAALACGAPRDLGLEVALRLLPDEPPINLDRAALSERETVREWSYASPEAVRQWAGQRQPSRLGLHNGALVAADGGRQLVIGRQVELDAAAIDALELEARYEAMAEPLLRWAGPGERFSAERSLAPEATPFTAQGRRLLRFPVRDHPAWRGRVSRLQLRLRNPRLRPTRLYSLRAVRVLPDPVRLAAAAGTAWSVTIGSETRSALLGIAGRPIERRLTVPPAGELRFAFAVNGSRRDPVRFRVAVKVPGAVPALLFDQVVPGDDEPRWHEGRVDLSSWAGQALDLRLTADATAVDSPRQLAFWGHPEVLGARGSPLPPSIVLVVLDTVRADALSLYGNPRPTTPRIDAWASAHGAVFSETVAAAPWTLPSHASMLSGIDPHRHGAGVRRLSVDQLPMAPEMLRAAGYATLAITGGGFLDPRFGWARGFDVYRHWREDDRHEGELAANVDRALAAIEGRGRRPFFLLFHTYEVHAPYRSRPPAPDPSRPGQSIEIERLEEADELERVFLLRETDEDEPRALTDDEHHLPRALYESGLAYTDRQVGRLLERLRQPDLAHQTVVVLTSDHGEALGEEGRAGHGFLDDTNLLVPLVIATPDGLAAGETIAEQVRGVDLLPTLLDLADLPVLPSGLDGVSLVPALRGEAGTVPRIALSYSQNFGLSARLRGGRSYPVPGSAPETEELPGPELGEALAAELSEADAELRRQLEALGYVD